jgi:hypothetical protein
VIAVKVDPEDTIKFIFQKRIRIIALSLKIECV